MKHRWVVAALAIAVLIAVNAAWWGPTPLQAQQVPLPAAVFFGSGDTGSAAVLDGRIAEDASVVSAWNERGLWIADTTIHNATWIMHIDPHRAMSVIFSIGESARSPEAVDVVSGTAKEVALDLRLPGPATAEPPAEPTGTEAAAIEIVLMRSAGAAFVAWTSIDTDAATAFASVANLDTVWWWDGEAWQLFAPRAPAPLSTNYRINSGTVLFVVAQGPVTLVF